MNKTSSWLSVPLYKDIDEKVDIVVGGQVGMEITIKAGYFMHKMEVLGIL